MWETTVVVERSVLVDAPQEEVFSLLADPAAFALREGHFAFAAAAPPGSGPLRCWLLADRDRVSGSVFHEREEVPGQAIGLRTSVPRGRQGGLAVTLAAVPKSTRAEVTVTVRHDVPRGSRTHTETHWSRHLKVWLLEFRAAVEGRRSWPGTGIPPDMWQRWTVRREPRRPMTVAATMWIAAPPERVWELVSAPEVGCGGRPGHVVCAGRLPGTPQRQVGELRYDVIRLSDKRLSPCVSAVTELVPSHRIVVQNTAPALGEMRYTVSPMGEGTTLSVEARFPASTVRRSLREYAKHRVAAGLRAELEHCKAVIEG